MKKIIISLVLICGLISQGCSLNNSGKENTISTKPEVTQAAQNAKPSDSNNVAGALITAEKLNFSKQNYPKLDGSTATIPLSEAFARVLLKMNKEEAMKFVKHNKTHNAYVNLVNGSADIILVTEPSNDELKMAKEANVELEVVPVVREGFVFLTNTANPVNNLTSQQVRDIYQGKIKNWNEVGGKDKEIMAFQRQKNSGSQTLMEQLVMKDLKLTEVPKSYYISEMEGLIEEVAKYENSEKALGYSMFYYAKTMFTKDNVKLLSIDGVVPENKAISEGKYPFKTSYFAVLRKKESSDSSARKMLQWILGEEGQKVSEGAGYVPLQMR